MKSLLFLILVSYRSLIRDLVIKNFLISLEIIGFNLLSEGYLFGDQ